MKDRTLPGGINDPTILFKSDIDLDFSLTIITGICRSGKTTLGNLLATCDNVEYADEPHTAMLLPMAVYSGKIDWSFGISWFRALMAELFNETFLLRSANFRPNDLSSIWSKKTPKEILDRLVNLNSRQEVKEISQQSKRHLVVTLSECSPFVSFICEAFPDVRLIYVTRSPYEVAEAVVSKKWYSDAQLLKPLNALLYKPSKFKNKEWYLPWWVDAADEASFLSYNEFGRGLYYWNSLTEKTLDAFKGLDCKLLKVTFDELMKSPQESLEAVCQFTGALQGPLTHGQLGTIKLPESQRLSVNVVEELALKSESLLNKLELFK